MYQSFIQNAQLSEYCTYRTGGKAKYLARVGDTDGLFRALELSENRLILGNGSKVLISDEGFDGVVIVMGGKELRFEEGSVYAAAGVTLPCLSKAFAEKGLKGLEWACGIPGTIGGALKLNAGAYGSDMSKITLYVDVLRGGKQVRLSGSECGFGYRHSGFYPSDIILGTGLLAEKGDKEMIEKLREKHSKKRVNAQPQGRSCGSVFKAGEKPAYEYILAAGLSGMAVGGARISTKHANFILNVGARSRDIYTLIQAVKAEVYAGQGVKLAEEVIYIGDF